MVRADIEKVRPRPALARSITVALAAVLAAALVQPPATATDIGELQRRAQVLADDVSALERERSGLVARESDIADRVMSVSAEIGVLEAQIHDANAAVEEARDRYVERAREAYKSGSMTRLALLLSADTLGELVSMAEATLSAGELEGNALDELLTVREDLDRAQSDLDVRKQELIAAQGKAQSLNAQIDTTIADRRARLKELTAQISELEAQARTAAMVAARAQGIDVGDELLKLLQPAGPSAGIPKGFASTGVTFEGIASWYGPGFEGNATASGQIFDSSLYTAASKELPLGSWLHVSHQGRGVVVLVNDRGPYIDGRILDLSHAAAQAIGITGLGWVKATILIKS
jgi:rare lipoprotein A (peptidoglycan hydrolase)